jgi:type III secretory pathway component EscV
VPDEDVAERLITHCSGGWVRIRLGPDHLEGFFPAATDATRAQDARVARRQTFSVRDRRVDPASKALFGRMRDQTLYECGVRVPEIIFEVEPTYSGTSRFCIDVNQQRGLPRRGPGAGELLTEARLSQELRSRIPTVQPANDLAMDDQTIIVPTEHRAELEAAGLRTWGPIEFLSYAVGREVRRMAWCLISVPVVEQELALFHDDQPELALLAVKEITLPRLARVLRTLLREQVPIRDLGIILERLLLLDRVTADTLDTVVYDDRLIVDGMLAPGPEAGDADCVEGVRAGLKRAIVLDFTKGNRIIPVFTLNRALEARLLEHLAATRRIAGAVLLSAAELDEVPEAIRAQYPAFLGSRAPALVTSRSIRSFVRELIEEELPAAPVFAYDEIDLAPDVDFQHLGEISITRGSAGSRAALPEPS